MQAYRTLTPSHTQLSNSKALVHQPSPMDLVDAIDDLIDDDMTVILEPGRSLVGNTALLVTTVLGTKRSGNTK